jgi:hypothetical protein
MVSLSPDTVVARRTDPLTARVDDDLVMLDPRQSQYFALDGIGRRIWELLDEPRSVDALCTELQAQFRVEAETCRTDVLAFLEELSEAGLLEIR